MASRKDFVQRTRNGSSASPSRPAAKPRAKAAPPPPAPKPWGRAILSLVAVAGLVYLLNQLLHVSPESIPQTNTQAPTPATKATHIAPPAVEEPRKTITAPKPKPQAIVEEVPKNTQSTTTVKPVEVVPVVTSVAKTVTPDETPAVQPKKYEFYELLPKSEVNAELVEAYKSTPRDAKLDKSYLLQAGSFRNEADAEKMRAKLILSGLSNVKTDKSDGSNGTWYRVRLGPFDNRLAMNQAQNKLAKLKISAIEIRIN